jgi:dihydropteroate synthase-like protein
LENCTRAREAGISCIIADPLIQPVGSGFTGSIRFGETGGYPLFFGAGNVSELLDTDSIGVNALLAGMAYELGASVIFTSEHSDKTRGSVKEMRTATEMMVLTEGRPYPKDLGIDLLVLKEKGAVVNRRFHTWQVSMPRWRPERLSMIPAGISGSGSRTG